jgi:hypothetical protein
VELVVAYLKLWRKESSSVEDDLHMKSPAKQVWATFSIAKGKFSNTS